MALVSNEDADAISREGEISRATRLALQAVRRTLASDIAVPDEQALDRLMFRAILDVLPKRPDAGWYRSAIEERPELLQMPVAGGLLSGSIKHGVEQIIGRSVRAAVRSMEELELEGTSGADDSSPAQWHR